MNKEIEDAVRRCAQRGPSTIREWSEQIFPGLTGEEIKDTVATLASGLLAQYPELNEVPREALFFFTILAMVEFGRELGPMREDSHV